MGSLQSVQDVIDALSRRARLITALFLAGCLLSLIVAAMQKHSYRAFEVIQIQAPKVAAELAPSVVDGFSVRRLQLIQQQVMSRDTVLDLINTLGIYQDLSGLTDAERVALFRESVQVAGVAAARIGISDDGTVSVIRVTAEMPDPIQARDVAHQVAQRTIELGKESRLEETRETVEFFRLQEAALKNQIVDLEEEISEYRNKNDVSLAGAIEQRRSEISSINQAILEIDQQVVELRQSVLISSENQDSSRVERRNSNDARKEITTLLQRRGVLQKRVSELSASIETTPEVDRQMNAYSRQLQALQNQLEETAEKRSDAEMSYHLVQSSQSGRLAVIEAAEVPEYPFTRSRKMSAIMGAVASMFAAMAFVLVLEMRNLAVRNADQMESLTGLRPIVTIPSLASRPVSPLDRFWSARTRFLQGVTRFWQRKRREL